MNVILNKIVFKLRLLLLIHSWQYKSQSTVTSTSCKEHRQPIFALHILKLLINLFLSRC